LRSVHPALPNVYDRANNVIKSISQASRTLGIIDIKLTSRHWQWLSLRARRTRRAVPSLLFIIFIIAVTSIVFFPGLDVASIASLSSETRQGEQAVLQGNHDITPKPKDPPLVQALDKIESVVEAPKSGLDADDPLIVSIGKLRRELAANYKIEQVYLFE
jgi:hypothetical protein